MGGPSDTPHELVNVLGVAAVLRHGRTAFGPNMWESVQFDVNVVVVLDFRAVAKLSLCDTGIAGAWRTGLASTIRTASRGQDTFL